jgi:hypothetical protein
MGEPKQPRNPDQEVPPRTGEDIGSPEPVVPQPAPEPYDRRPLPEEETYEREGEQRRPDEQRR